MLEARNITKEYGTIVALNDVSAQVSRGALTVVMGPSGGGKSTLVRGMSLLEPMDKGEIVLDGNVLDQEAAETGESSLWPTVTVVFQQLFLWPHKTVAENVTLPSILRNKPQTKVKSLVERLGISQVMDRFPNQISIGQRQRAALARALLLEPQFLLLDEITAALDVEQISLITEILTECLSDNMGLLVVTHHLGFARRLMMANDASKFVFLERGKVAETGNTDELDKPSNKRVRAFLDIL